MIQNMPRRVPCKIPPERGDYDNKQGGCWRLLALPSFRPALPFRLRLIKLKQAKS
jgi:hypothetical protein